MADILEIPAGDMPILQSLRGRGVPFVVIGGQAARFYGINRSVPDTDLLVDSGARAAEVGAVIEELGGDPSRVPLEDFGKPGKQIPIKYHGYNTDLLTSLPSLEFDDVLAQADHAKVGAMDVPVISREHLVVAKRATGRAADISEANQLESLT